MKSMKRGTAALLAAAMIVTGSFSAAAAETASAPAQDTNETKQVQETKAPETQEETKAPETKEETKAPETQEETKAAAAKPRKAVKKAAAAPETKAPETETKAPETKAPETEPETKQPETEKPVENGWDSSKTMYYENGKPVTGFKEIGGYTYCFSSKGRLRTGWVSFKDSDGKTQKRYFTEGGSSKGRMVLGLKTIDGNKYYFGTRSGYMKTGLQKAVMDKKTVYYYFSKKTGKAVKGGYIKDSSVKQYYAKANGKVIYKFKKVRGYWRVYNMKNVRQRDLRKTVLNSKKYRVRINSRTNVVTIVARFHDGKYTLPIKAWRCSTGKNQSHATPRGTFNVGGKYRWNVMMGGVYCQWLTQITGDYLIHSEIYNYRSNKSMRTKGYNKLGRGASHGCVRMPAEAAKWIYDNCGSNAKIVIFKGDKTKDPLGKPALKKLPKWHTWDPTDPTARKYCKKKGCHQ